MHPRKGDRRVSVKGKNARRAMWATLVGRLFLSAPLLLVIFGPLQAETQHRIDEGFNDLVNSAEAAKKAGRDQDAIELYRKALAQRPEWPEGWRSLGMLSAERSSYAEAREAFTKLIEIEPRVGDGWVLLGICDYRMGRYDQAVAELEKARAFPIRSKTLTLLLYYHTASAMIWIYVVIAMALTARG